MYMLNKHENVISFLLLVLYSFYWNPIASWANFGWTVFMVFAIDSIFIVGKNMYVNNIKPE